MLTESVHVDDLESHLNIVQAGDLTMMLRLTPARRRVDVALAFAGITRERWAHLAGISPVYVSRWITLKTIRLPYGGALRLSRVLGVNTELLFEWWSTTRPSGRGLINGQ